MHKKLAENTSMYLWSEEILKWILEHELSVFRVHGSVAESLCVTDSFPLQ